VTRPALTLPTLAAVALGGALGALLRWSLGELVPDGSGFPWTTWAINVVGCFLLAAAPGLGIVRRRPWVALAVGPGLLGGFTTLSAYAERARGLLADGRTGLAAAYLLGTLAACLLAAHAGAALAPAAARAEFEEEEGNE
jgi:CrcB protein